MSKSVLISIQPYWVFLIIAKTIGWNITQEKTIEVRKNFPKDTEWNKKVIIYCSKDKKSFNLIPKEYQLLMERFLGKVVGEFTCDKIDTYNFNWIEFTAFGKKDYCGINDKVLGKMCLSIQDIEDYACANGHKEHIYGWHINDLKIYDEPKELSEVWYIKKCNFCETKSYERSPCFYDGDCLVPRTLTRPFQSWGYVEKLKPLQNETV